MPEAGVSLLDAGVSLLDTGVSLLAADGSGVSFLDADGIETGIKYLNGKYL